MGVGALEKKGGKFDVNGLIEDYYVYAGENISAGSFVEFVNGVAEQKDYGTSTDMQLSSEVHSGREFSSVALDDSRVFVAHSYGEDSYVLYGVVLTISGATITVGTDTKLGASYTAQKVSTVLLDSSRVFISYSNSSSTRTLYAMVVTIDGNTITAGTAKSLASTTDSGLYHSSTILSNGNVFIAYCYGNNHYLYGVVCTISGTTISKGSGTSIVSSSTAGYYSSVSPLPNAAVFIAHGYGEKLYGIVCATSGTTITNGDDTQLSDDSKSGKYISTETLPNGNVFIAHSRSSTPYLNAMICTVSGTSITAGTDTSLSTTAYSGNEIATALMADNLVFIAHSGLSTIRTYVAVAFIDGTSITYNGAVLVSTKEQSGACLSAAFLPNGTILVNYSDGSVNQANTYRLHGRVYAVTHDGTKYTPTANIVHTQYETQVRNTTSSTANGIAKTSGIGGDETAHNEAVQVYEPDV